MIANLTEYQKAQEEIRPLEEGLERLLQTPPVGSKGFTEAGIRKTMSSRRAGRLRWQRGGRAFSVGPLRHPPLPLPRPPQPLTLTPLPRRG